MYLCIWVFEHRIKLNAKSECMLKRRQQHQQHQRQRCATKTLIAVLTSYSNQRISTSQPTERPQPASQPMQDILTEGKVWHSPNIAVYLHVLTLNHWPNHIRRANTELRIPSF